MNTRTGWGWVALAVLTAGTISAQTLTNQSLSGKYFFRHVSVGTDSSGNLTDARSLIGTMTFDGAGNYSYTGQQVIGSGTATTLSNSGKYTVDPAGFVTMDNPQRSGAKINARLGSSMLAGSTTETTDNTFDLFGAVLAPTAAVGGTLAGPYYAVTLEFPGATTANARNTFFSLSSSTQGQFAAITVNGHAANLGNGGAPTSQQVTAAAYTMGSDGTGSFNFGAASTAQLLSGTKTVYLSADGNVLLGGSTATGSHDFFIAVKALTGATNTTWNGDFWGAGLRSDPTEAISWAGAVSARGLGNLTWAERYKQLGQGTYDLTQVNTYSLTADGSGTYSAAQTALGSLALGAGGKAYVASSVSTNDQNGYEIYFGAQMNALSGTGVFLNPQRVLNAASYAPAGNPIAPGEFIALFGTGMAASTKTATPPYPLTFNGVTVLINGKQAPLYYVSATQINALVPYSTQGPTATVVVQNGSTNSNTVTVPVAATAPGIFSLDWSGTGAGAVEHTNFSVVNAASPASRGETVLLFLSGLGTVTPTVNDGYPGNANNLSYTDAKPTVFVGDVQVTPMYSVLHAVFPGLYQVAVTIPTTLSATGNVPIAVIIGNAYHDQVTVAIQ
ncbi:MAG TPA: IPT/TIG domain-containing protein [Bryobacteraceae bacterium]|nr:IPT/TIG domain-containing protein [Bryobacteraceae bacterium]